MSFYWLDKPTYDMYLINQVYDVMVYGVQRHFPQHFSYTVAVRLIGGGNRGTRGENHICESERRSWRGVLDTTLCDKVCQSLATGRWFSPRVPRFPPPIRRTAQILTVLSKYMVLWYSKVV
jgi:hypothetical protein